MKTRYTINGQFVTQTGIDPFTREPFTRCYWVPQRGGYVYLDTTPNGDKPGTLGRQVCDSDGSTWRATGVADLLAMVKAAWRAERRAAAKA